MLENAFDIAFRSWVEAFCASVKSEVPQEDWFERINDRLPRGLRETIALGIHQGTIKPVQNYKFSLEGLAAGKSYSWFGKGNPPWVNWEWFVHAAEYARIRSLALRRGFDVKFEHDRMDIAVLNGRDVIACYEVKEDTKTLDKLIAAVRASGAKGVDRSVPDKGNDPLRKAKYLTKHRPLYFSAIATGKRYEFSLDYVTGTTGYLGFALKEDMIPI